MRSPVFCALQDPPYWNGWVLSACMHAVVVGSVLFLSHQLPTPQIAERDPIAVSFVTPQLTRTPPTHRPTIKQSPSTPTTKSKQVQPKPVPREPTRAKPRTQTQIRQTVSPQMMAHASVKPVHQPTSQLTNVTRIPVAQPKPVRHTASEPAISSGTISSQPKPQHTGIAQHHTAAKVHASPTHRKPIHGSTTTEKVERVTPLNPIIRHHVANAPQRIATPVRSAPLRQSASTLPAHEEKITRAPAMEVMTEKVERVTPLNPIIRHHVANAPQRIAIPVRAALQRQSVHTLPSHEEKITRAAEQKITRAAAMEVMKQQVARGRTRTAVRHVFSKPARQQAAFSSENPVVQTRATFNFTRHTRKVRPATTARPASTKGFSPELLAYSKLLREKIARTLKFPRLAKRLGYSGTTHVAIALSKTGIVRDLKISQPSGYEILDKAAVVTLKKVLQTTKPPESIEIERLVIPIAFNLKRN